MTLDEVHRFYGTIELAASAVNVTRQAFHAWKRNGEIPLKWQGLYEKVTNGRLKAQKYTKSSKESDEPTVERL
jgi:hypothetical protein